MNFDSVQAERAIRQYIPDGGLLYKNAKGQVISFMPPVTTDWTKLRGKAQRELLQEAERVNAVFAIVSIPSHELTYDEAVNIVNFGAITGIKIDDIFDSKGSLQARGMMPSATGTFLQAEKAIRDLAILRHENFNELSKTEQDTVLKEAKRQLDSVKVLRDEQGRLITEAGKLSKLNEHQYRQVRTEWFKDWFGDWQLNNKPDMKIAILKDTIFSDKTWEAKQQAANWAKSNIRGEYKNNDTGWNIRVSKDGIQKITSGDRQHQKEHLEAIRALSELLQNAILAESHADRNNNPDIKMVHRFYSALNINNALYRVKLTVVELNNGNKLYDHSLTEIEEPVGISGRNTIAGSAIPGSTTGSVVSIANLLKGVKKNNGSLFDVSKVIDPETGEPMVVYHGTAKSFGVRPCRTPHYRLAFFINTNIAKFNCPFPE